MGFFFLIDEWQEAAHPYFKSLRGGENIGSFYLCVKEQAEHMLVLQKVLSMFQQEHKFRA